MYFLFLKPTLWLSLLIGLELFKVLSFFVVFLWVLLAPFAYPLYTCGALFLRLSFQ